MARPRSGWGWVVAGISVAVLAVVFVRLGFWQLDRLDQRRSANAIGEQRLAATPVDLATLLAEANGEYDSIEYRPVLLRGTFDPSQEVLIRSQVELGQAGFHVITPMALEDGGAVLVNRGWVPLDMDRPPVDAPPPPGPVEVEGWVHTTQTRPPLGPEDPAGDLQVFNRVDVVRISEQVDLDLADVYVVETGERGNDLPLPPAKPEFTDEGPHLAYAIQWFGFAIVAVVGFGALYRRRTGRPRPPAS